MADETFGISVIEAQASGLPVVGVAAGAMVDRVTERTRAVGPVDDAARCGEMSAWTRLTPCWSSSSPGSPGARAQSVGVHLLRHADLSGRRREVAVIDPGPDLPEHVDAMVKAIGGRPVAAIMCTHTHRDHSPASRPLAAATGAPIIGCAPLALESVGPRADAAFDGDYRPTACWRRRGDRGRRRRGWSRWRRRGTRRTICASPMAARCSPATM
jgi:hypothetical protein